MLSQVRLHDRSHLHQRFFVQPIGEVHVYLYVCIMVLVHECFRTLTLQHLHVFLHWVFTYWWLSLLQTRFVIWDAYRSQESLVALHLVVQIRMRVSQFDQCLTLCDTLRAGEDVRVTDGNDIHSSVIVITHDDRFSIFYFVRILVRQEFIVEFSTELELFGSSHV